GGEQHLAAGGERDAVDRLLVPAQRDDQARRLVLLLGRQPGDDDHGEGEQREGGVASQAEHGGASWRGGGGGPAGHRLVSRAAARASMRGAALFLFTFRASRRWRSRRPRAQHSNQAAPPPLPPARLAPGADRLLVAVAVQQLVALHLA